MNHKKFKHIIAIVSVLIVLSLLAFWAKRVYDVNAKAGIKELVYSVGEEGATDSWAVELSETKMMSKQEFKEYFGVEADADESTDDKMICMKLKVRFLKDHVKTTDIEKLTENGFRTLTWYNGIDPFLIADINQEMMEKIYETKEGTLWIVTNVPPWVWSREYTYEYVLSTFPEIIMFRDTVGKGEQSI